MRLMPTDNSGCRRPRRTGAPPAEESLLSGPAQTMVPSCGCNGGHCHSQGGSQPPPGGPPAPSPGWPRVFQWCAPAASILPSLMTCTLSAIAYGLFNVVGYHNRLVRPGLPQPGAEFRPQASRRSSTSSELKGSSSSIRARTWAPGPWPGRPAAAGRRKSGGVGGPPSSPSWNISTSSASRRRRVFRFPIHQAVADIPGHRQVRETDDNPG